MNSYMMSWMAIGVVVLVASVALFRAALTKRPVKDLGSLSSHWVAQHQTDR